MGDDVVQEQGGAPLDLAGAMAAARELLARAESDSAAVRADAHRYVRQREQEVELLIAKARRMLSVAEEKAAGILVAARSQARVIDLDGSTVSVPIDELTEAQFGRVVSPRTLVPTRLDAMLASAITSAVDLTFAQDHH